MIESLPVASADLVTAALQYAGLGYRVLALHSIRSGKCTCGNAACTSPGKHPLTPNGLQDASTDEVQIRGWWSKWPWANIGLALGQHGLFALDVDERNGGHLTLEEIVGRHGALPDTPTQRTGNGQHFVMWSDRADRFRGKLGPGIDVKVNGYIVAEPSFHMSGKRYAWEDSADLLQGFAPARAPHWLDNLLTSRDATPASSSGVPLPEHQAREIRSALSVLDADDYHEWIQIGMALHSTGAGDQAFGLWAEWSQQSDKYDPRVQRDKWRSFDSARDQAVTVRSIFAKAQGKGWANPMAGTAPAKGAQPAPELVARRLSIADLASRPAVEPKFLIRDWLPSRAVTLFSAHGSGGKSQIALHMSICLAAGMPFMGVPVDRRYRVFVYSCEDDETVLHFRLQRIAESLGVDLATLDGWLIVEDASEAENVFYTGDENPAMRLTYTFARVERAMRDEEIDVLVLDNASDVFAANEISRADVRDFISKLKRLATIREEGAVLLLGHVNRESTKAGSATGQAYSGSTAWHNSVRSRWELRRQDENAEEGENVPRVLTCVKSNYGREGHSHAWVWNFTYMTFVPETPRSPLEIKIIRENEERQIALALVDCVDKRRVDVRKASSGVLTTAGILAQSKHFPKKYARSAAGTIAKLEEMVDAGLVAHEVIKVDRKSKTVYVPTAQGRALAEKGSV